jgi:hypothetical protein
MSKSNLAFKQYSESEEYYSHPITEATLYHSPDEFGFFTLGWSFKSGRQLAAEASEKLQLQLFADDAEMQELKKQQYQSYRQASYKLNKMHAVLHDPFAFIRQKNVNTDTIETSSFWLSQSEFSKPNRQKINLLRVGLCWVDIDTHHDNSPSYLKKLNSDEVLKLFLDACDKAEIPYPSIILWTGRGLACKWIFDRPLPKQAYPRWAAVQDSLVDAFESMGADDNAKDASRVLRLAGTYNPKTLDLCHPIYVNDHYGDPKRYTFDDLADAVLPYTREQIAEFRAKGEAKKARIKEHNLKIIAGGKSNGNGNLLAFNPVRLAWLQVDDYRKIAKLRPVKGREEGFTDNIVWLAASALAMAVWADIKRFDSELIALVKELAPHWDNSRISQSVASVRDRAEAMARGEWVTYNGKKVPPVYTPKHSTIIDMLGLTDDEMTKLDVIISDDIKKDRHKEAEAKRRRKAGAVDRDTYLMTNADKKAQAVELVVNLGRTVREAAEILGVSAMTVSRWTK